MPNQVLDDEIVFLSTRENKEMILRELSGLPHLCRGFVFSIEELEEALLGVGSLETLVYLMEEKGLSYEVATVYLDHFKYLYLSPKGKPELFSLLEELKEKGLWKKEEMLLKKIKDRKIIVIDLPKSKWNQFLLGQLSNEVIFWQEEKKENVPLTLWEGKTWEEVLAFLAEQLCLLHKQGIPCSDMVITNLKEEDRSLLQEMFSFYHLPLQKQTISFGNTDYAKRFLRELKNRKVEEALSKLDQESPYYKVVIDCLNSLVGIHLTKETYFKLLTELFQKKQVVLKSQPDGIRVESFLSRKRKTDHVFVLNVSENSFPVYQKDEDYFSDEDRLSMGLDTSLEKNQLEKEQYLLRLDSTKHIMLLSCLVKNGEEVYPSSLLSKKSYLKKEIKLTHGYSHLYNQLLLGKKLDTLRKYQRKEEALDSLWKTYPHLPYQTYSNQYQGVSPDKIRALVGDHLVLSYSSINHFYQCGFRFYLERILKLNTFEETFSAYLGSLYHKLLSLAFLPDFDFEKEFSLYLKRRDLTAKEVFLLRKLHDDLFSLVEVIKEQNTLTEFQKALYEQEVKITFSKPFSICLKGLIDKILFLEKDDVTYFAVIDYKTGLIPGNMEYMTYGLDMQLGIYLYLIMHSSVFPHPKPVGFYFQKMMEKSSKPNDYRLQGYTTDQIDVLEEWDKTYPSSKLIKGMKYTDKGFGPYTKLFDENKMETLLRLVESKIQEAIEGITSGMFSINPKMIGKQNVSCPYCPYRDICFMTDQDLVYLDKREKDSFMEEGEEYA